MITRVFVDHVYADLDAEPNYLKGRSDRLKDEAEDKKIKEDLGRELKLSSVKTGSIRDYLKIAFLNNPKKKKQFSNAYSGLTAWEEFSLSRLNPHAALSTNEIAAYALDLRSRGRKAKTASNKLLYLSWYFDFLHEHAFYNETIKHYQIFVGEFEKEKKLIPIKYVWNMYKHADDIMDQVLMRLLIFETTIPILWIEKIKFFKTTEGIYTRVFTNSAY